jgi:ubiquitin-protein ligase
VTFLIALHPYEVLQAVNEAGEDNMLLWNIVIDGPMDTPYEGGKFRCKLTFPKEFPNHAPHFEFTTQIFHPNFPNICPVRLPLPTSLLHLHFYNPTFSSSPQDLIGIGPKTWKNTKYVPEYIGNLIQVMREPAIDEAFDRNEAFHLYQSNRAAFTERARTATLEYAKADA